MRVKKQVRSPAVKHGEETEPGSQMLRVGSDRNQGLGGGAEENAVDHSLVLICDRGDLFRDGEYDVKIGHLEKFRLAVLDPSCPGEGLTFGTVAIGAAVVAVALMS